MVHVGGAHHVHVKAGVHGELCGMLLVFGIAVHYHLIDAGVVADHKAFKAPFAFEDVCHEVLGGMGGDAVQFIEGCHYA